MSGGLAPSKSTVYISNLPFSLTNNDLHKVLEKHGKVVKVTIVKDKITRRSKGLAFVLFLEKDSAQNAVNELNGKEMFGRTVKCSIAKDNGRTTEFIRKKYYTDKSRCFECGEEGHMSYRCPKNALGDREPPKKKEKKRKRKNKPETNEECDSEPESIEDPSLDTLSAAIRYQQEKQDEEEYRYRVATGEYGENSDQKNKRLKVKKGDYFSDDEEVVSE